ncbi:DUF4300 family protein [Porphyromonas sp. COT-239 OH1446]|uniref:DUF4300 family protein n=1 Tax=Porphyromonas sp. COT-239 OH1446 TaxID=1515613 RepID=UPI00052CC0C5|nr:DUF4300 family protein [Porphyromonas sp. COT-239 OH1446]KGN69326.1 hypothetical protein HQ37_05690 [Porphyromonas sp. COT-239 OH1446]
MKHLFSVRRLLPLAMSLMLGVALSNCSSRPNASKVSETAVYCHLFDPASQEEVSRAMMRSGLAEANVSAFIESVRQFYDAVGGLGLVREGYEPLEESSTHFDAEMIQMAWDARYPSFAGYNCRITSFALLQDLIRVDHPIQERPETLFFDDEALDSCGRMLLHQRDNFYSVFSPVPTAYDQEIKGHVSRMQEAWRKMGISFPHKGDPTKASLISVVMHSAITPEDSYLFVGHAGVLIPTDDGLLFVEKLSFQAPYMLIRFPDRTALNDYLMRMYDTEWGQPTASPFLLENDELLEGYRPNPNKPTGQDE